MIPIGVWRVLVWETGVRSSWRGVEGRGGEGGGRGGVTFFLWFAFFFFFFFTMVVETKKTVDTL